MSASDIAKVISSVIGTLILTCISAVIAGFFVWLLWPYTIPSIFSKIVAEGYLPAAIGFWDSVFLSWITGALFKTVVTSK